MEKFDSCEKCVKLLQQNDFDEIMGQKQAKTQLKSALLASHHVLIVGPPGVGKTTLAKNVAEIKGKKVPFVRVQGSPDLTVEDLLGDIDPLKALKYGPLSKEAFVKGKIFKAEGGVLFFDEINRAPEKLQNALLEVLQEGKATIGSYDVDFPISFVFIGTMNPHDSSTEKLSDVLLDRFDVVYMSHPETTELEQEIVKKKGKKLVEFPQNLIDLFVNFIRNLRNSEDLDKVPSVRATLSVYQRAQTHALLQNNKTVSLDDIKATLISSLAHRISLKPSVKFSTSSEEFLQERFASFMSKEFSNLTGGEGL